MPARALSTATISFGLVSIPVKLFTTGESQATVSFNMLHQCGTRVKQQYWCPKDERVVPRDEIVKGYEFAKGQYVTFSDEELKALEANRSNHIEIVEFVPISTFDFVQIEKTYYLGADKGGDKAYRLLSEAMKAKDKVAVGRWAARGKEQLVIIRPYKDGLALHQLFYANEVRSFEEADDTATFTFSDKERDLAEKLIDQLSTHSFQPEKYKDDYADRVRAAVDQKVAGKEIVVSAEAPRAQIIDLFEALKKSLAEAKEPREGKDVARAVGDEAGFSGDDAAPVTPRPVKKAEPRKASSKKSSVG